MSRECFAHTEHGIGSIIGHALETSGNARIDLLSRDGESLKHGSYADNARCPHYSRAIFDRFDAAQIVDSTPTDGLFAARVSGAAVGVGLADVLSIPSRAWLLVDLPTDAPFIATQRTVSPRIVAQYVADPLSRSYVLRSAYPLIVERDGCRYIADGHHRIVAARLRGDDTITVWLTPLDGRATPTSERN
jgi:hypothetical protein